MHETLIRKLKLGLNKKDVCLPFSDRPKIVENKSQLFFFFQFRIFKQKCENKISEYIETVPQRHFYQI